MPHSRSQTNVSYVELFLTVSYLHFSVYDSPLALAVLQFAQAGKPDDVSTKGSFPQCTLKHEDSVLIQILLTVVL
jgi:hypothetical protein